MTRAWTRSCAACSVRKGLIFRMLWSPNLQDWAVFAMCYLKVSWSSKIAPRFLTKADGVIVDEPNWIVKSCCRVGVAGKTRSSVFTRLSCRWCSFIHAEIQAAWDPCSYHWIIWSKWEIELCVISEVESQWYPVMRGWTGGSNDWQCQKWQTDQAEWGLMIWNRVLQFAGLQWPRVAQSQLNGHSWNLTV